MKILVSACLLGSNCKYSGGNNQDEFVLDITKNHEVISICPELLGGLPVRRASAEIVGQRVKTKHDDVTKQYQKGALAAQQLAMKEQVDLAILQPRSPSCGCGRIYDGTFSGRLIAGDGLTTQALRQGNIPVFSSEEQTEICQYMDSLKKIENSLL